MKKINKKDLIIFILIFIITLIIFIPFLKGHYATDTYNIANVGYQKYAINWSLKDGRIFMAILGLIADKINMPIENYVFITLFCALIISNITVITLKKIIEKYKKTENLKQEIILVSISYVTIFNFMYLENMYFVESIVMATSALLFIVSANILVEKNKYYIVKSLILIILGIICYQGTVGIFLSFVFLFSILKNKNNIKQIIIDMIKCGVIAFVSVLINIVTVKIIGNILQMEQTRLGSIANILNNIKTIILTMPNILQKTCNLFPENALIIFLIITTFIILIYQLKNIKENSKIIYKYILIILITIISSCATYLLTLTSFYTGRLRNALGALVGIIFIFLYVQTDIFDKKNKLQLFTQITLILFFILNIINYENIMLQHKKVNTLEKKEVQIVEEYIKKYEQDTGISITQITKVPIYNNLDKGYFSSIKNKTSFTHNALKTSWAADGVVNFYTKRDLKTVDITKGEKQKYINVLGENEQYKCIDNTLYVNVYIF